MHDIGYNCLSTFKKEALNKCIIFVVSKPRLLCYDVKIFFNLTVNMSQKSNNTESILYVMLPVLCTSLVINICTITWYVNVFSKNYVLYCFKLYSQKQTRFKIVPWQRIANVLASYPEIWITKAKEKKQPNLMTIPFYINRVNNNMYIF